jgi:hypothetical protein
MRRVRARHAPLSLCRRKGHPGCALHAGRDRAFHLGRGQLPARPGRDLRIQRHRQVHWQQSLGVGGRLALEGAARCALCIVHCASRRLSGIGHAPPGATLVITWTVAALPEAGCGRDARGPPERKRAGTPAFHASPAPTRILRFYLVYRCRSMPRRPQTGRCTARRRTRLAPAAPRGCPARRCRPRSSPGSGRRHGSSRAGGR